MSPSQLLTTLATALGAALSASAQDTAYFSYSNKPTLPQLAYYYQITVHTDSGWTFSDHWMNDQLKDSGRIANDRKTRVGTFSYYDTAGVIVRRCKYIGHGGDIETDYYPEGQVSIEGTKLDDKKNGEWTAYYPSGKIKAKALYTDDQQVSASFLNEDGSPNTSVSVFFRAAEYPGGDEAWLRFLNKNLHYPDAAVYSGMQGTVIVQFKISKEGKTSDFLVIQSADKDLDKEALRVIKKSGDWEPALSGGSPVESYKSQPIVFTFNRS